MKLIVGNFGARNLGDELILYYSLQKYGKENCVVVTADADFSKNFCEKDFQTILPFPTGVRSFLKFVFNKKYRQIFFGIKEQIDEVIFPGGGLFAIRNKAYWIWFINFLWVYYFIGKPIRFLHQGIDEPKNFWQRFILKFVFSRVDKVTVRDKRSAQALFFLGKDVEVVDDIVYANLNPPNLLYQGDLIEAKKEDLTIINARTGFENKKWPTEKVIFVAFEESDLKFCPDDFEGQIIFPKTKTELWKLLKKAKFAVGERLHFLILAEKFYGAEYVFSLRQPYSDKVGSFCNKKSICIFNENR